MLTKCQWNKNVIMYFLNGDIGRRKKIPNKTNKQNDIARLVKALQVGVVLLSYIPHCGENAVVVFRLQSAYNNIGPQRLYSPSDSFHTSRTDNLRSSAHRLGGTYSRCTTHYICIYIRSRLLQRPAAKPWQQGQVGEN